MRAPYSTRDGRTALPFEQRVHGGPKRCQAEAAGDDDHVAPRQLGDRPAVTERAAHAQRCDRARGRKARG